MKTLYPTSTLLSFICVFTLLFCVIGTAQAQTGYVKFESNADSFKVVIDYNYLEVYNISNGDSIEIKAGLRFFRMSTPFTKDRFVTFNVKADTTLKLSYTAEGESISIYNLDNNVAAVDYYNANLILLTDGDTDIFYEDSYVGTGYAMINASNGNKSIRYVNKYGYKKSVSYRVLSSRVTASSSFLKPTEKIVKSASVIPGASQILKRQHLKASLFLTGTVGSILYAIVNNNKLNSVSDEYNRTHFMYRSSTNEVTVSKLGDKLKELSDKAKKHENRKNIALGVALGTYIYNIYDGITSKPIGGFRDEKGLDFYFSNTEITNVGISSTATLKYNF